MRQRLAKLGVVRRLLFVLQTDWYCGEAVPWVINALYAVSQANFSRDDTIKPTVSFLAANLHGGKPFSEIQHVTRYYIGYQMLLKPNRHLLF